MSMAGHHALLLEIVGGVVIVAVALSFTLRKKKAKVVEDMTTEDMQRIADRLHTGDVARTQSRFRRRYGVDARAKDFVSPKAKPAGDAAPKLPEEPSV